jgi:hypothetical protein
MHAMQCLAWQTSAANINSTNSSTKHRRDMHKERRALQYEHGASTGQHTIAAQQQQQQYIVFIMEASDFTGQLTKWQAYLAVLQLL